MKYSIILLSILLSGCVNVREMTGTEVAWQTMNAIDIVQTLQVAKFPECYEESNWMTKALIGKHPSESEVLAVGVLYGWGHAKISEMIRSRMTFDENGDPSNAWEAVNIVWNLFSFVGTGSAVLHNHQIGVRPFNNSKPCP